MNIHLTCKACRKSSTATVGSGVIRDDTIEGTWVCTATNHLGRKCNSHHSLVLEIVRNATSHVAALRVVSMRLDFNGIYGS
jgi:hypothetical protein